MQNIYDIFIKQNHTRCKRCGTQRCDQSSEWLEGCKYFQLFRDCYLKALNNKVKK